MSPRHELDTPETVAHFFPAPWPTTRRAGKRLPGTATFRVEPSCRPVTGMAPGGSTQACPGQASPHLRQVTKLTHPSPLTSVPAHPNVGMLRPKGARGDCETVLGGGTRSGGPRKPMKSCDGRPFVRGGAGWIAPLMLSSLPRWAKRRRGEGVTPETEPRGQRKAKPKIDVRPNLKP